MDISVNRITNANICMDGAGLLGRAEEIQIAQPHHRMVDHKALGMAGTAEFWAGVEKLEAKIKWASALYRSASSGGESVRIAFFPGAGKLGAVHEPGTKRGVAGRVFDDRCIQGRGCVHLQAA
jgi:hypothetical protein